MNLYLVIGLAVAAVVMMVLERLGVPTTLELTFKGDIKRETLFLAQYGQSVATPLAALLVWELDEAHPKYALAVLLCVCAASILCFVIKRLTGRVRPNRENAGKFLGPSWKHANWRESFPSSHSACAMALSTPLAHFYPHAAETFWGLAILTALLRYVLSAHWPSDVLSGLLLGYAAAHLVLRAMGY
jgi:membrane-associated phospholipid phosphatase